MRYSKETIYKAYEIYKKNNSLVKTAKETGISKHSLALNFHELGLREFKMNVNDDTINEIINMYNNNMTMELIAKELNLTRRLVNDVIRVKGVNKPRTCKYVKDESVFEIIDSEEKAYWLGFLYADGYINTNKYEIELTLAEYDKEHLEKFKLFLNSNAEIKYRSKQNAYRICIQSKKIINDLIKLGCTQNKSLTLTFPTEEQVPKYLIHHFLRGYIDGDGSIGIYGKQARVTVIGTKAFLDEYEKIILKLLNRKKPNKRQHEGQAYSVMYNGNKQVKKIINFLYNDATIYLERKYNKIAVLRQDRKKSQDD